MVVGWVSGAEEAAVATRATCRTIAYLSMACSLRTGKLTTAAADLPWYWNSPTELYR
jgi:hypothetical protein